MKPFVPNQLRARRSAKVLRSPISSLAFLRPKLGRLQIEFKVLFLHFARGEDLAGLKLQLLLALLPLLRLFLNLLWHRVPPSSWRKDRGDRFACASRRSRST